MSQINLHITPQFEKTLKNFMRLRGFKTKSEAISVAVKESLERAMRTLVTTDFSMWLGMAKKKPLNLKPRFKSDDDLWRD